MKTAEILNIHMDKDVYFYWEDKNIKLSFNIKFNKDKNIKHIKIEYWIIFNSLDPSWFSHEHFEKFKTKILKEQFKSQKEENIRFQVDIPIDYWYIKKYPVEIKPYIKIFIDVDWSLFDIEKIIFPEIKYNLPDLINYEEKIKYKKKWNIITDEIIEEDEITEEDEIIEKLQNSNNIQNKIIYEKNYEDKYNQKDKEEKIDFTKPDFDRSKYTDLDIYNFWILNYLFRKFLPIYTKWDLIKTEILKDLKRDNTIFKIYNNFLLSKIVRIFYYLSFIIVILAFIVLLTDFDITILNYDKEKSFLILFFSPTFVIITVIILKLYFPEYLKKQLIDLKINKSELKYLEKKLKSNTLKIRDIIKKLKIKTYKTFSINLKVYLMCKIETYHEERRWSWKNRHTVTIYDKTDLFEVEIFNINQRWELNYSSTPIEKDYNLFLSKIPQSYDWWDWNKITYFIKIELNSDDLPDLTKEEKINFLIFHKK